MYDTCWRFNAFLQDKHGQNHTQSSNNKILIHFENSIVVSLRVMRYIKIYLKGVSCMRHGMFSLAGIPSTISKLDMNICPFFIILESPINAHEFLTHMFVIHTLGQMTLLVASIVYMLQVSSKSLYVSFDSTFMLCRPVF